MTPGPPTTPNTDNHPLPGQHTSEHIPSELCSPTVWYHPKEDPPTVRPSAFVVEVTTALVVAKTLEKNEKVKHSPLKGVAKYIETEEDLYKSFPLKKSLRSRNPSRGGMTPSVPEYPRYGETLLPPLPPMVVLNL